MKVSSSTLMGPWRFSFLHVDEIIDEILNLAKSFLIVRILMPQIQQINRKLKPWDLEETRTLISIVRE